MLMKAAVFRAISLHYWQWSIVGHPGTGEVGTLGQLRPPKIIIERA